MSIFDNLDRLIRDVTIINESKEKKKKSEAEIDPELATEEQARKYVRKIFAKHYFKVESPEDEEIVKDEEWPDDPEESGDDLPDPFDDDDKKKGKDHTAAGDDLEWGEDSDIDDLLDDASGLEGFEDDDEDEEKEKAFDEDDLFDDFGEKKKSRKKDEDDDEEDDGEEDEDEDDDDDAGKGKSKKKKSKKGDEDGGEDGDDEDGKEKSKKDDGFGDDMYDGFRDDIERGTLDREDLSKDTKLGGGGSSHASADDKDVSLKDKKPTSYSEFKDDLRDALKRASEMDGGKGPDTDSIMDKMDKSEESEGSDEKNPLETIGELKKEIDRKLETPSTPVGSMVGETTDEDLKKELEEHGYSGADIDANTEAKNAEIPTTDEKEEKIRKAAMKGFEEKAKGDSKISKSILYKALKNREFTEGVWDELIEKIIKDKSKKSGKDDNKHKEVRLGSKNHLWRGAVLPTYKIEKGSDKKKIYCFVDWSGSVTGVEGLIESFLGKVIHVSEKLDYEDMDVYGFGNKLSLPRKITKEMRESGDLEKILTETRKYMDSQGLGESIENFNEVAHEINRIKSKDEESLFFIFGDGIWTFYGNTQPPVRLKEVCPEYRDDIYAFIFYKKEYRTSYPDYWDYVLQEIAAVVDNIGAGLGSDHVILAPIEDISK